MLLRPLYESWLLRSTREPLAPWQRALLLRALNRDEALRCLAAELAAFSHDDVPADLHAPNLRPRLLHLVTTPPAPRLEWWEHGWARGAVALTLLALLLSDTGFWHRQPVQHRSEMAQVQQPEEVEALRLPTLTPTPTPTPMPNPSVTPTALPQVELESEQP